MLQTILTLLIESFAFLSELSCLKEVKIIFLKVSVPLVQLWGLLFVQ